MKSVPGTKAARAGSPARRSGAQFDPPRGKTWPLNRSEQVVFGMGMMGTTRPVSFSQFKVYPIGFLHIPTISI